MPRTRQLRLQTRDNGVVESHAGPSDYLNIAAFDRLEAARVVIARALLDDNT